jgi:hypothetical protein
MWIADAMVVVDEVDPLVHGAKTGKKHEAQRNTPCVADILLISRVYLKDTNIFSTSKITNIPRIIRPPNKKSLDLMP